MKESAYEDYKRLLKENEELKSTLKIIHTWASFDISHPEYTRILTPQHVVNICNKALKISQ